MRPRCYLDVEIEKEPVGRITTELYNDICPITSENFRALCTGEKGIGVTTHKPLCYKNTNIHRIVKNFVIQSGDFDEGNGTGGESIYGGTFADENFILKHNKPFLLSMANRGKDTNGSQFFITLTESPHLDTLHTVFGRVLSGFETIKQIENIKTDHNCRPLKEVKIAQCGELVLKSEKRKKRKRSSSSYSSSSEEERKKKKKLKKEKKKSKREKKSKGFYSSTNKAEEDMACNVDPDEIPAIPANNFLMRRTSPVSDFRRSPRGRDNFQPKRRPTSRTRSGRKVKGRGNMRYRTPSSDEHSGSETPPHWKQAQSRLKKYTDVLKEKANKNSDSEQSNDEDERPQNRFLRSRLGLINFEEKRENDAKRGSNDNWRRSDTENWRKSDRENWRRNSTENRRRRDSGRELSRDKESGEEPDLFKKLLQEDERHGSSWFQHKKDQSDESPKSPLKSKVVRKSSESRRDSRSDRRGYERESSRRYEESSRRRDSPSERRSRNFHRDSSSGHDNSFRKSDHLNESKKETEKKSEPPKKISAKSRKRLNLLECDLFRYNKNALDDDESTEETSKANKEKSKSQKSSILLENDLSKEPQKSTDEAPKAKEKKKKSQKRLSLLENDLFRYAKDLRDDEESPEETSEANKKKNVNKNEKIDTNSINSAHNNNNLTFSKEYEAKSNEKCENECSNNVPAELSNHESENNALKEKEILTENTSEKNIVQSHESQYSDTSSQKIAEFESEKEMENNFSAVKLGPDFSQSRNFPIPAEQQIKDFRADKKDSSPSHDSTCSEDDKLQKHIERRREELKSIEAEELINMAIKQEKEYGFPPAIPLPDENEDELSAEAIHVMKNIKIKTEAVSDAFKVTEKLSVDSSEAATRKEFRNKDKKHQHDDEKKSPRRRSPSLNRRRSDKKNYDRASVSPSRSVSPSHHKGNKKNSADDKKASSYRRSRSPVSRQSRSPPSKGKSSVSRRRVSDARRSKSRSRSRSVGRSSSRNKPRRKYSRSPDVRQRRSRSRSRNVGRGNYSQRPSSVRNRSPEFKGSYQRRNRSPYRGRARGRSTSRRSKTRSRSHSVDKKRRHRRHASSSSSSSSSSSGSGNVKRRNLKKSSAKRKNKRSSSSSSSSSSASSRSN